MAHRSHVSRVIPLLPFLLMSGFAADHQVRDAKQKASATHNDVVIRGGIILTVTHGKIENGSIYVHNGKIAAIGRSVNAPAGATVIDASGKWVMPREPSRGRGELQRAVHLTER